MTQEVRVILQLTLDVDAELTKEEIAAQIHQVMEENFGENLMMTDIMEIREEAEIYEND